MVGTRTRCQLAAVAVACAALVACGGGDGKGSVPTVTFAGGDASVTTGAASGSITTAGGATGATTTGNATTTTLAPTTATTAATTVAPEVSTPLTTGSLASLPPGYTDVTVKGLDPAAGQAAIAGYQAWLEALRAVGSNPAAPPWDRLQATTTSFGYPKIKKQFEDVFAQGQSWVIVDAGVSRARIESVLGPTLLDIDDCQTEWSYRVETATGTPVPGEEAAVAGPTNTGYHVTMVLQDGTWRVDGYDATRSQLCAGI